MSRPAEPDGRRDRHHDPGKGIRALAYVIAEPCIGEKDNSCVEVCPVDCIHPTPDEPDYDAVKQLFIDPDECIDCDACVEACPVDACFANRQLPEGVAEVHADQPRLLQVGVAATRSLSLETGGEAGLPDA